MSTLSNINTEGLELNKTWWDTEVKISSEANKALKNCNTIFIKKIINSGIDTSLIHGNNDILRDLSASNETNGLSCEEFRNFIIGYLKINSLNIDNMSFRDKGYFDYQGFNPSIFRNRILLKHGRNLINDLPDLIQLCLATGSLKNIKGRSKEALPRMLELKEKYGIDVERQQSDENRITLPRISLAFPIIVCNYLIENDVKSRFDYSYLPEVLKFSGSSALIPDYIWKEVSDSFIIYNVICSMYYSGGKAHGSSIIDWQTKSIISGLAYSRAKAYCDLNRSLSPVFKKRHEKFYNEVIKKHLEDFNLKIIVPNFVISNN